MGEVGFLDVVAEINHGYGAISDGESDAQSGEFSGVDAAFIDFQAFESTAAREFCFHKIGFELCVESVSDRVFQKGLLRRELLEYRLTARLVKLKYPHEPILRPWYAGKDRYASSEFPHRN